VRDVAVEQLGRFKNESGLPERLAEIAQHDAGYRVRTAALLAYAQLRPRGGLSVLQSASKTDSPDDVIRRAALRAMGSLGDDKAVDTLLDWSEIGKPIALRSAALASLAQLDKKNQNIEKRLETMLDDPAFDIRTAAVNALGERDDSSAIPVLEAMRKRTDLPVNFGNVIDRALDKLKHVNQDRQGGRAQADADANGGGADADVAQRLSRVEQTLTEVNDRLKRIEDALPAKPGAN
jgi:HEAT repeat protein